METAHKQNQKKFIVVFWRTKWSNFKAAGSKQVIQQQFANEVFELASRESTPQKSSSTKAKRKRQTMNEKEIGTKKMVIFTVKHLKEFNHSLNFFSIFELEIQIHLANFRGQNDSGYTFKLHQACGI